MRSPYVYLLLAASLTAAAGSTPQPLALHGLDPVQLVAGLERPGDPALRFEHGRFAYQFATREDLAAFEADPDRYGIQAEGHCLHMPSMDGDPAFFKVVQGKIYLAGNAECLRAIGDHADAYVAALTAPRRKVAILLFPSVEIIDYTGPWEVFGEAGYDVFSVALSSEPLSTAMGMRVTPTYALADAPDADIIVLPGGGVDPQLPPNDPRLGWVRRQAKRATVVMSVCNGTFWLAQAGLLDGQRATTTSNGNLKLLARLFPKIHVVSDERFVDLGRILTTAGLSSGIDGALHVVEKLEGRAQAQQVALGIEYDWHPEHGFARGALADRYLRSLGQPTWPDGVKIHAREVRPGLDHWSESWDFLGAKVTPDSARSEIELAFAGAFRKVGSRSDGGAYSSRWSFRGDDGKPWSASLTVGAPRSDGAFTVTLATDREGTK